MITISDIMFALVLCSFALCAFFIAYKFENKRQKKFNALIDEMYLYYKNTNDKEFNL